MSRLSTSVDRPPAGGMSTREIDRLLLKLSRARCWRLGEGRADGPGMRLVAGGGAGPDGAEPAREVVLAASALEAVLRAGLIERRDAWLSLSGIGRARVRRMMAGGDDGFRRQHQRRGTRRLEGPDGRIELAEVNEAESPLAWLRRRRGRDGAPMIDEAQFAAGERLRADHAFAAIGPSLARPSWEALATGRVSGGGARAGGPGDLGDATIDARARVERARQAVGPELFPVLVDVCCELKGLEEVERARDWPSRSAKLILSLALTRLARHYGYAERVA